MKVTTSIKLDKKLKDDAAKLAEELGLNLSTVISATLKKFVSERAVQFYVAPEFNEKTKRELLKIKGDIKTGKNIIGPFDNIADLRKSLLS